MFKDKLKENQQFNDDHIAKYAKFFNELCVKNHITSFWWDTSFLIDRVNKRCFQKIIDGIMCCYKGSEDKYCENQKEPLDMESAEESVRKMRVGWNLGNTLDANKCVAKWDSENNKWQESWNLLGLDTETCWFQPKTTKEMIHYVKKLGFGAVRVPVTWAGHLDSNNNIDDSWLLRVKEVVDFVLDEGMYCLINVHHDGGGAGWVRACESSYNQFAGRLESIYSQIGNAFKDYNQKLLFCGVNEILDENASWADPTDNASFWIDKWNQLFVDTVRKTGKNNATRNLVVMAGAGKSSIPALTKFHMPKDTVKNHMIFEFHNYDPQSFCWHQNPQGTNKGETPYWDEKVHGGIISKAFDDLLLNAKNFNVPIICGEYAAWPKIIEK